jgi:hypothetical protein
MERRMNNTERGKDGEARLWRRQGDKKEIIGFVFLKGWIQSL